MPTYAYRCLDKYCGEVFEEQHGMQDSPEIVCPECGGAARKVILYFPHTELNWKAHDRNDTGSDRMTIGAARHGKTSPMDDRAQRYKVRVSNDT